MDSYNGDLYFKAGIDDSQIDVSARAIEKRIERMSQNVQTESLNMDKSIQDFAIKGAEYITTFLVGKGMMNLLRSIVDVRGEFQQLEIAFETMLGSADKANSLMAQLTETAAKTPFDLKGVAAGAKQLLAYGTAAEEVNEVLVHLGDIAAGMSIPLNDIVMLYGTTMTQGRMYTQDLRQFMGRGIPLAEELAKQFGVTKDKVAELVTQGKVTSKEFNAAIMSMSSEGGKFYNLMEKQSASLTGQISNLEDAWDMAMNDIGKSMEGIASDGIAMATTVVENLTPILNTLRAVAIGYGSLKAALILNSLATKGETGVAIIDNTVKKAKIQLLQLEEKATSGTAQRIAELKAERQSEIESLEAQLSAEERLNIVHKSRIANIESILTQTQKSELANLGLTTSSEDYERVALSMMNVEQRMSVERNELTNNTGEYIKSLHEAVDVKTANIKSIDDTIEATQKELKFATEYKNVVQEQVNQSRERVKSLQNEVTNLDLFGDSEQAAAKMEELKAEKTKLATLEEELNSAATSVNQKETELETLAKQKNTAATTGSVAADRASATSKGLLAVATTKAKMAIQTLWMTMKANPIGWILTIVGSLIAVIDRLKTKSEEAAQAQKELQEEEARVTKSATDMHAQLDADIKKIQQFTGSVDDEKIAVNELNGKYGEVFGKYKTLSEWYDILVEKSESYVQALYLQAKIQKAINDASDVDDELKRYKNTPIDPGFWKSIGNSINATGAYINTFIENLLGGQDWSGAIDSAKEEWDKIQYKPVDDYFAHIEELKSKRESILQQATDMQKELSNIQKDMNINLNSVFSSSSNITKEDEKELKKRLDALKKLNEKSVEIIEEAAQAKIDAEDDSFKKRKAQSALNHQKELDQIKKDADELLAYRRQYTGDPDSTLTDNEQKAIDDRKNASNKKASSERASIAEEEISYMRQQYKEYEQWVELVGQEAADKHFKGLREKGEDFSAWVTSQIAILEQKKRENPNDWQDGDERSLTLFSNASDNKYFDKIQKQAEIAVGLASNLTSKIRILKEQIEKVKSDASLTEEQRAMLGMQLGEQLVQAEQENLQRYQETYKMYSTTRREMIEQYQSDIDQLVASGNTYQAEQLKAEMKRAMGSLDENFLKSLFGEVFNGKATSKATKAAIKDLNKMKGMDLVTFNDTYNTDFTQEELVQLKEQVDSVNSSLKEMGTYSIADAFKDIRDGRLEGDLERVARGTQFIQNAFSNFTQVVSQLSSALNDLAESSDNENLKNTAKTVSSVSNVLNSAGSWASTGASIGGGWGALAGAAIGGVLGIITEVVKSGRESDEKIASAAEEGVDFQQRVSAQLLSILDAVQSLDETITSLNYEQFKSALLGLINELRESNSMYKFGSSGKGFWNSIYDSILGNKNNTGSAVYGSGLGTFDIWERFVSSGLIGREEAERRWNDARKMSESQDFWERLDYIFTFGTQNNTHFDSDLMKENTAKSIADYLNWYFGQFAEEQRKLIDRLEEIYNKNSFDSLEIFNAEHDVYDSQYRELNAYKSLYEMLGLTDTDEYRQLIKDISSIEQKMGESLQSMAEGLFGTDLQGVIEDWISIFQEFGDNVDGAFDKIDEGIDRMITNMLLKRNVVEPLLEQMSKIFTDYAQEVGDDHEYTEDDFRILGERLRNARSYAYDAYQTYLRALEEAGISIDSLSGDSSSLTGAIQNVSEETAGVIAGRMNAIVINQAEATSVLRQSLFCQIEIRNHTAQLAEDVRYIRSRIGNSALPGKLLHYGISEY